MLSYLVLINIHPESSIHPILFAKIWCYFYNNDVILNKKILNDSKF